MASPLNTPNDRRSHTHREVKAAAKHVAPVASTETTSSRMLPNQNRTRQKIFQPKWCTVETAAPRGRLNVANTAPSKVPLISDSVSGPNHLGEVMNAPSAS